MARDTQDLSPAPKHPSEAFERAVAEENLGAIAELADEVCKRGDELLVLQACSSLVLRAAKSEFPLDATQRRALLAAIRTLRVHTGTAFHDHLEDVVANAVCMLQGDMEAFAYLVEELTCREEVQNPRLAANIAGVAAQLGREDLLWDWLGTALERGADADALAADSDFAAYRDHAKFEELLAGTAQTADALGDDLFAAAESLDLEAMRELLAKGADPNYQASYESVMEAAVGAFCSRRKEGKRVNAIAMLIEAGAAPPELADVVRRGQALVELVLAAGSERTYEAVLNAAEAGNAAVLALVAEGISLKPIDSDAESPFLRCRLHKDAEIANSLLELGARLDEGPAKTLMHNLASADNCALMRWLVDKGGDVNAKDTTGDGALCHAAFNDNSDAAQTLLELGYDVQSSNSEGQTALHACARYGAPEVAKLAMAAGASPAATDSDGKTALDLASSAEMRKILSAMPAATS